MDLNFLQEYNSEGAAADSIIQFPSWWLPARDTIDSQSQIDGCISEWFQTGRWALNLRQPVERSLPIERSESEASFVTQGFVRQSSALGRSSGLGCRTSRRKSSQATLKSLFLIAEGREGAVSTYLHTSRRLLNRGRPASIRYKIHPRDQMSTLLVFGFEVSSISGAM